MRFVAALRLVLALGLLPAAAVAGAPEILSHQGHLLLPGGASAPDGSYAIRFGIFDAATGGLPFFERELTVRVEQGVYHVLLSGAPGELEDALRGHPRYLGLTVVAGPGVLAPTLLSPRQEVGAVPFARFARTAAQTDAVAGGGAGGAPSLPTGAILLAAEPSCPPGFEALDGSSQQGGVPHDLRGRIPIGADTGSAEPSVADQVGAIGGVASHLHARGSQLMHLGYAYAADGSSTTMPSQQHHHNSSSNCSGGCWSSTTSSRPPFATVTFCRKI